MREGITRELGALPGHATSFAFATSVRRVAVGLSGPLFGETPVRWLPDGTVLYGVADAAGNARFDVLLPPAVRGKIVLAQAVEPGRCRWTSLSATRVD